jgi:hypothetical protein
MLSAAPLSPAALAAAAVAPAAVPGYVIGARLGASIQPLGQPQNAPAPYDPQQVQTAYGVNLINFNGIVGTGAGQTVAIVDAYNDPNIIDDTKAFDTQFNLQQFNVAGGPTFQVLGQTGTTTLPTINGQGWDLEESLDVQWVHSMAPQANIILFEANSSGGDDMYQAETTAADFAGVSVVSNSWGSGEFQGENTLDSIFTTPVGHQGVTFLSGSGDHGEPGLYPAFSPNVIAVGGTNLQIQTSGAYISESVWNNNNTGNNGGWATGGGISTQESQPSYQTGKVNGISTSQRLSADVSADADGNSGVYVYDSFITGGPWWQVGGTSLATPLWAGMIAIANQGRVLAGEGTLNGPTSQILPMLYNFPSSDFNDVTLGNNGTYSAGPGYDLPTGLGTPNANLLIPALAGFGSNQPPSITAPANAGVTENTALTFSTANSNAISVTDVSSGLNADSLTLSVSHGTLTLASLTGLQFTTGSNGSALFTVTGTIPNLDAGLSGLIYTPTTGYVGSDSLSLSLTDPGTSQTASATVSLTVVPPVTGNWTAMTQFVPNGDAGQLAMLLPNGQLFVHGLGDGQGDSPEWYLVTPDSTGSYVKGTWAPAGSMNVGRLYFGSTVLPNGEVFVVGGEYSSTGGDDNTAEIYNPVTNIWTNEATSPKSIVGDEPTELLPNGNVLVGDIVDNGTEIFNPIANTWSPGGTKVRNDQSDEEPWVKLANGDILTYDLFSSANDGKFEAELYNPSTNTWSDASQTNGTIPILSSGDQGFELGPALLLPDGRALFTGATGLTAFYDPSTNLWTQGPTMPSVMINGVLTQLTMGDAPGAVMPNGDLMLALSPAVAGGTFPAPTFIYDFNPTAGVYTDISPSSTIDPNLSGNNSFINTMLVLPTGQLLLVDDNNQLAIYTPTSGAPQQSWRPVVTSFTKNANGTYMLTGQQLNGLDEGAAYGDDNQMAENYPIVQVTDTANGHVLYATTSNWSLPGLVATGTTPETVTVTMPTALGNDPFTLTVIADGIASNVFSQAPAFTAPNAVSVNQNSVLSFTGNNTISLSDALGTAEQATLSVSHGTLSMTGAGVSNSGTSTVTFTGTLADLNAALATLTYTPTNGYNGSDKLSLSDTDTGDSLSGIGSVAITVSPVAPSISVPAPVAVPMNSTLPFAGANVITVADISGTNEQMTLQVSHGILTLTTTGLTTANGNGTASVTLGGALATLNTDLATLVYTPTPGYSGGDTLSLSDKDTTDVLTGTASVSITVEGAPTVSTPTTATVTENGSLTFSSANNNSLTVADLFADGAFDALTVSVSHGIVTLGSTSGVNITGGSDGSSSVTLTGTIENLNAALSGLVYQPNLDFEKTDTLVVSLNNPADGLTGSSNVSININALAPTIAGPAVATVDENTSLIFSTGNGNAISINDVNSDGDSVALSVGHGTLTLSTTTGLTFTNGNNGTSSFTVSGTLSNLSAALNGLIYQPTLNYFGSDSLAASITNVGNHKESSTGVILNIDAIPTVLAPSGGSLTENTTLTFSSANNNGITVADQSAGSNSDSLTLSVSNGIITMGSTTGLTFTGSNGSSSFTVTGTLGHLTAGLNGLIYQPNINYVGSDSLVASLFDPGDGLTGNTTVPLSVNAVTAPTIGAPSTATVAENGTLVFTSGNSNAISVADNGAGGNADALTMTVSHGTLTLASTTGLIFTAGGNGSASFTVKGTLSNLGAALTTVTYQPTANFAGSDSLAILIADSADGKSGSASVGLTVSALAPSITAPRTASVTENGSFVFSGSNLISIADAFPSATDSLKLSVAHGTLTLASTAGLTITGTNGSASFTVSGTVNNLNAALIGLSYQPTAGYFGPDTLGLSLSDPGDSLSGAANVAITVNPLSAPSITAPGSASLVENTSLVFSSANTNAITLGDSVAGSNSDSLMLSVAHGTLTLATTSGLTVTAGNNGTASFTVTGTVSNLNTALSGLIYQPTANYVGADSLAVSITDPGDNESASTSVSLSVTAFSPPSISAPVGGSVVLNGSLVFSSANHNAITVADSGPGSGADSLKLSVAQGTVTLASTAGLTITSGANGSASITVIGSVANLNAALNGLTYKPTTGYTGADSLAISLQDTAKGDGLSASSSVALSVAVSPPAITAPPTASVTVTSTLVFSSANKNAVSIADINAGSAVEPMTLTATDGTLTLGSTNGITFTSGTNNSAGMTIDGTLANLNAALSGLTFTPAKIGNGTIVLSYTDLGNGLIGTATINVTVLKGVIKLGSGTPASSPSASSSPASSPSTNSSPSTASSSPAVASSSPVSGSTGGGTVTAAAAPPTTNGTTGNTSTSPDAEAHWQGVSAAVEVLIG